MGGIFCLEKDDNGHWTVQWIITPETIPQSRLSALIAENDVERTEISKKMLCLWDLRSDIVHARRKKPTSRDVKTLSNYVRRAVERGLSLRDLSKKELVAKLDRP